MGTALVTGATAGLGREFCWELAARRHDVVLVARDEARLEQLARQLWQVAQVEAEVLPADLATEVGINRIVARLETDEKAVGLLVNNAGFGLGKPFLESSLSEQVRGLDVMVKAVMETSYAAATAMRRRGRGAILNVSSIAADTRASIYSAHKSWVRSFTEGLADELCGTGVIATALMPGLMHTEFHQRSGQKIGMPKWVWLDPARVADQALDAVALGKISCTPGPLYKLAAAALKVAPTGILHRTMRRLPHT